MQNLGVIHTTGDDAGFKLIFIHLFDVGCGRLRSPVGGAIGSLAGPQHVAQPFDLLQGGGLRDLKLDVPNLLRRQAGSIGGRSGRGAASGRKWLARNERLGALLDFVQLLLALLRLEQGFGIGTFLMKKLKIWSNVKTVTFSIHLP